MARKLTIKVAETFWTRFKGLMLTQSLSRDEGLLLRRCRGVHTFFMRYSIDVIFLNEQFEVVQVRATVKPWSLVFGGPKSAHVLEVAGGVADELRLALGSRLNDVAV